MVNSYQKNVRGSGGRLRAAAIVFVACACGWFIMELEILGIRSLAPYFGSAVYVVMGSVIGVFLLSLAAGYMIGGWLSKKTRSQMLVGVNLIAAGVWIFGLPFFIEPVCEEIFRLGLDERWGSLIASFILFTVPTLLFGTVSPAVVRWLTTRASEAGFNAGLVFSLSTVASFAGSVITAFYLVLLSTRKTMFVSGIVLAVLGATVLIQAMVPGKYIHRVEVSAE